MKVLAHPFPQRLARSRQSGRVPRHQERQNAVHPHGHGDASRWQGPGLSLAVRATLGKTLTARPLEQNVWHSLLKDGGLRSAHVETYQYSHAQLGQQSLSP
jgi:hypothetical protein